MVNTNTQIAEQINLNNLSLVIIAGGLGSRVGFRQKALLPFNGKPVIETMLSVLKPQVNNLWINVNTQLQNYQVYSENLFSDRFEGYLGPLAGMHAAWDYITTDWALFVPCDNPNLPNDFVAQMLNAHQNNPAPLVVANDGDRMQPLYLLMHRSMASSLETAIEKRHLSVNRWVRENDFSQADFSKANANTFQNMNTLQHYDS